MDFGAPVVYNKTALTSAAAGSIVYDSQTGQFFGLTTSGAPSSASNWSPLSAPSGSFSVVSGGTERIERATITNNGSCSIASQSGSWVTSVTHPGAGQCTLTITGFSAAPTCTCIVDNGSLGDAFCQYNFSTATSTSLPIAVYYAATTNLTDANFNLICMGPQ